MSGAQPPQGPAGAPAAGDPSMEDILASIRRILSEDEATPPQAGDFAIVAGGSAAAAAS